MKLVVDESLVNELFNYLATKPYNESAQLIHKFQQDLKELNAYNEENKPKQEAINDNKAGE